jgi:hypothetical protein
VGVEEVDCIVSVLEREGVEERACKKQKIERGAMEGAQEEQRSNK